MFTPVARHRGFARAAAELGISIEMLIEYGFSDIVAAGFDGGIRSGSTSG